MALLFVRRKKSRPHHANGASPASRPVISKIPVFVGVVLLASAILKDMGYVMLRLE